MVIFYNPLKLLENSTVLQITFQAINTKKLHFSVKPFQRDQNKNLHFFLYVWAYFDHDW